MSLDNTNVWDQLQQLSFASVTDKPVKVLLQSLRAFHRRGHHHLGTADTEESSASGSGHGIPFMRSVYWRLFFGQIPLPPHHSANENKDNAKAEKMRKRREQFDKERAAAEKAKNLFDSGDDTDGEDHRSKATIDTSCTWSSSSDDDDDANDENRRDVTSPIQNVQADYSEAMVKDAIDKAREEYETWLNRAKLEGPGSAAAGSSSSTATTAGASSPAPKMSFGSNKKKPSAGPRFGDDSSSSSSDDDGAGGDPLADKQVAAASAAAAAATASTGSGGGNDVHDPLAHGNDPKWQQYFARKKEMELIDKDLNRLYFNDIEFFEDPATRRRCRNVLEASLDLDVVPSYSQGMHEMVAIVMYVLHTDALKVKGIQEEKHLEKQAAEALKQNGAAAADPSTSQQNQTSPSRQQQSNIAATTTTASPTVPGGSDLASLLASPGSLKDKKKSLFGADDDSDDSSDDDDDKNKKPSAKKAVKVMEVSSSDDDDDDKKKNNLDDDDDNNSTKKSQKQQHQNEQEEEIDHRHKLSHHVCNDRYLEHDAFFIYVRLIKTFNLVSWYENQPPTALNSVTRIVEDIHCRRLARAHMGLHDHLKKFDIPTVTYGLRWLRLLFVREFPISQSLKLWDAIFAEHFAERKPVWQSVVPEVAVSMLLFIANEVVEEDDHSVTLRRLMRFPPVEDITALYSNALNRAYPDRLGFVMRELLPPVPKRVVEPPQALVDVAAQGAAEQEQQKAAGTLLSSGNLHQKPSGGHEKAALAYVLEQEQKQGKSQQQQHADPSAESSKTSMFDTIANMISRAGDAVAGAVSGGDKKDGSSAPPSPTPAAKKVAPMPIPKGGHGSPLVVQQLRNKQRRLGERLSKVIDRLNGKWFGSDGAAAAATAATPPKTSPEKKEEASSSSDGDNDDEDKKETTADTNAAATTAATVSDDDYVMAIAEIKLIRDALLGDL